MSDYPNFIVTIVPFRGKKLIYVLLLLMLAGAAFLFAVELYVTTHKHQQPPSRSPHAHPSRAGGTQLDPGTSPAR